MKMIIRDYFSAFRIRNIVERYGGNNFANWFPFLYPLIIMPILVGEKMSAEPMMYVQHYGVALLFLYGMFAAPLHPVALPKLLYLCPMDASERRNYIRQSYVLKIIIGMAVVIFGTVLLIICTGLSAIYGVVFVMSEAAAILCSANMDGRNVKKCAESQRSVYIYSGTDGWEIAALIISVVVGFFVILGVQWQEDYSGMEGIFFLTILIVIELPFVILSVRKSKKVIDAAVYYER